MDSTPQLELLPDVLDQKRCPYCGAVKHPDEFRDGRRQCRECEIAALRARNFPPQSEGEKTCSRCGRVKPLSRFHAHKRYIGGRHARCSQCRSDDRLRRTTGATLEWKAIKWALQMGNCPGCPPPLGYGAFTPLDDLVVDHHEPNDVKTPVGVLCDTHNWHLGSFGHDPATLRALADYCERTR